MNNIKIYSTNNCGMCLMAKNFIKEEGFEFEEVNLSENKEEMSKFIKRGIRSVPIIQINDNEIIGFKPGEIMKALNS